MEHNFKIYFTIKLIYVIYFFNFNIVYSQNYGTAWIVGYNDVSSHMPILGKTELNFANANLKIEYKPGKAKPYLGFVNTSIANEDGTLRYFTDGFSIFDGDQNIVEGGDTINYGDIWVKYRKGFYPTGDNHYFLPFPSNEKNVILLIHFTPEHHPTNMNRFFYTPALRMTKIFTDPITKESKLIFKDSLVISGDFNEYHMACTRHANGRDWWIIIEDYLTSNHKILLLDPAGIHLHKNQSIGPASDEYMWSGNSIFTPNGEKFIKYLSAYHIQIFDFDRCSGELSNPTQVVTDFLSRNDFFHLVVSPNNRFLYTIGDSLIRQYDLLAKYIKNTETVIGIWDGFLFKDKIPTSFYQGSLANDGKIYISCGSSSIYMHVINNPNQAGLKCNFKLRDIELPTYMFGSTPILPNYKLGPKDGSLCDSLGINNVPVAEFNYIRNASTNLQIDFRDLSYHEPEEWYWDFGDPNSPMSSSSDTSPVHIFSSTGIYNVCLTVKNSNGQNVKCKKVQLGTTVTDELNNDRAIVSIYPNPVKDILALIINDYLPKDAYLKISDKMGKDLFKSKVYHGLNTINIESLSNGIYYYSCFDKSGEIGKGKLVKMN